MRALVTTSGDSSRLPGPPPKSFRLLGGRPVVGHIIDELEQVGAITQIDVIVRVDHEPWAKRALWGSECDIILQPTLGLTERIRRARSGDEALVVCLGDTLVQHHADNIIRLIGSGAPRPRVLMDAYQPHIIVESEEAGGGLMYVDTVPGLVDVGSYYIPEGFDLSDPPDLDESLIASLIWSTGAGFPAVGAVDPVRLLGGDHWRDVGTPEGFAAAELALATGRF